MGIHGTNGSFLSQILFLRAQAPLPPEGKLEVTDLKLDLEIQNT